jgi:hypothetical protein
MLNVELTINGVVNYLSIEGHALTQNWRPRIISFDAPTLGIPSNHGGYAKLSFGNISFNPVLFQTDWPPPITCVINIYYTDTTEAVRELLFSGTAHLSDFDRDYVCYDLYGPSYDETIADATAYNGTLNSVITTILTTIPAITSVNTTYARGSSPNVTYTVDGVTLAIDLASSIAEFYSHLFYLSGATAYLVDMKLDNGTWTLSEYDFLAKPKYQYNAPIAILSSDVAGTVYEEKSTYLYGSSKRIGAYHTTEANIRAALVDMLAIENAPRIPPPVPMMAGNFPDLGQKIIIPDTTHVADLSSWIRVRQLTFDFIGDMIKIEGEGVISA